MSTKKTADRKPTLILGDGTVLYESQAKPVKLTPSELAEAVKNLGEYVAEYRTWLRDRRDDDVLPAYRWLRLDYPTRMELLAEAGGDDVTVLSIKIGMNYCLRQTATLLSKRADRYGLDPLPIRKAVQRCDFTDPNLAELARRDRIDLDNLTPLPLLAQQHPTAQAVNDLIPLDGTEVCILQALYARKPLLQGIVNIATDSGYSAKTVWLRLAKLIAAGLVHKPKGERAGATLTAKGVAVVEACLPPKP